MREAPWSHPSWDSFGLAVPARDILPHDSVLIEEDTRSQTNCLSPARTSASERKLSYILFLKKRKRTFLFCIGVQPINKQCGGSFRWTEKELSHTYTYIHSLPNTLPFRLPHNIEQSSMCYTVGLYLLSILNIAVCTWKTLYFLSHL